MLQLLILFKDTQQDLFIRRVAAAATTCVCLKIHSGNPTSTEIKFCLDQSPEWNINCLILEGITIASSLRETTAVIHYLIIRHRVQFAMWKVTQQSSWFRQEHSVPTAGPQNMPDIWSHRTLPMNEEAIFVWMRRRKLQLVQQHKTKHSSTLSKFSVDHCHVLCIPLAESWRV